MKRRWRGGAEKEEEEEEEEEQEEESSADDEIKVPIARKNVRNCQFLPTGSWKTSQ